MTTNLQSPALLEGELIRVFRPIPFPSIKLLVFDLDGTLADTAKDLCNAVNATLRQFGWTLLPDPVIAGLVGNGMPMLLRRSLAVADGIPVGEVSDAVFAPMYEFCFHYYLEHDLDYTAAYPGVHESLEALRKGPDGNLRTLAVLTNKPIQAATQILEGLGLAPYFRRIYGGDSFPEKKPNPQGLLSLMAQARVRPEETVMIGDSKTDVETARNAGAWILGCAFGFGPRNLMEAQPDVVVTSAKAWASLFQNL
jgi:phosphoglycolate phosphatase